MRVLLDTNIVLDLILKRPPFNVVAKEIFARAARKEIEVFVSPITPINAFYTTRKEIGKDAAFLAIQGILNIVEVAKTDKTILQNAFALNFNDYEDAVQCACALAENLDAVVTRNTKDFTNAPLQIYSPSEFLQIL